MRPLELEMEFIGPFVRRTLIDFTKFGDRSLFLITGKTGSGKTFIFDAMCYALYGATPSGRENNLASDFRKPGDRPFIRFRFQLGDRTYEAERTLPYVTSKKKGMGTTEKGETQNLKWLNGPQRTDEVLATKKTEVNQECERLLSLKMGQFSRVMLIPQGDFRELLKANTEEREPLLRQLFRSFLYSRISFTLEEMFKQEYGKFQGLKSASDLLLKQLDDRIPSDMKPPDGPMTLDIVHSYRDVLNASIPQRVSEVEMASKEYDRYKARTSELDQIVQLNDRLSSHRKEQAKLEDKERSEIGPLRRKMERHGLAAELNPFLKVLSAKEDERKAIVLSMERLTSGLDKEKTVLESLSGREKQIPIMQLRHESILSNEKVIRDLLQDLRSEGSLSLEMKGKNEKCAEIERSLQKIEAAIERMEKERERLEKTIEGCCDAKIDLDKADPLMNVLEHLIKVKEERNPLLPLLEAKEDDLAKGQEDFRALSDALSRKKALREGSLAAELSFQLEKGKPCPVCGSKRHPSPAKPLPGSVSKEEVESAERTLKEAGEKMDGLDRDHTALHERIKGLTSRVEQMEGEFSELSGKEVKDLRSMRTEMKERISAERKRRKDLEMHRQGLLELGGNMKSTLEERARVASLFERSKAEFEAVKIRSEEIRDRIEKAKPSVRPLIGDTGEEGLVSGLAKLEMEKEALPADIEEIRRCIKEQNDAVIDLGSKLSQETSHIKKVSDEISDQVSCLSKKLLEPRYSTFATVQDVEGSLLSGEEYSELTSTIDRHDSKVKKLKGSIEELEKGLDQILRGGPCPTLEEISHHKDGEMAIKRKWEELRDSLTNVKNEVREIDNTFTKMGTMTDQLSLLEPKIALMKRLVEQVKGNDRPRISLERFFLAQRFEEVLIEANQRLLKLSENRFILKRAKEDEAGARSRAGLDLLIFDNFTGMERPANNLSGGEMFLASLALALGLADVVQARSGGIKMEALFIDEGFGSLDEDALQIALKVLSELRKGRTVGVISHVQELKKQIPFQIEVLSSREGSTIEIRT